MWNKCLQTGERSTAAVEAAVEHFLKDCEPADDAGAWQQRPDAILRQIDRIPEQPMPPEPFAWDEHGLPR